ncbi:hypothetical protein EI77_00333 [Prosthecobacter fusiformis]|uniref:Secreted protein n=1 Tax=Prosthecobacter fusiformis TaxID=48464 RepID=A0A4R7SPU7_9BACT|nr:hypothetical protein [Prosthecobacter fusiformis]TDU81031.1 hypothetical protein EI77_00333 [Prosthecobacter fusiformis]
MFRSLILFIALLAQALPVFTVAREVDTPACSMSCCATVAKLEADTCGCVEAPDSPSLPAPANTPPAHSRDLLAQPLWTALAEPFTLSFPPRNATVSPVWYRHEPQALTQPHVRLPVLFCSLLT